MGVVRPAVELPQMTHVIIKDSGAPVGEPSYIRPLVMWEVWDGGTLLLVTTSRAEARASMEGDDKMIRREWKAIL